MSSTLLTKRSEVILTGSFKSLPNIKKISEIPNKIVFVFEKPGSFSQIKNNL